MKDWLRYRWTFFWFFVFHSFVMGLIMFRNRDLDRDLEWTVMELIVFRFIVPLACAALLVVWFRYLDKRLDAQWKREFPGEPCVECGEPHRETTCPMCGKERYL